MLKIKKKTLLIFLAQQADDTSANLRSEIKKLEAELFDSYDIIDELEFEVEQVNKAKMRFETKSEQNLLHAQKQYPQLGYIDCIS